ncbi:MAG: hypothetical protein OXM02_05165 [Bacteroidota bacterium]|nr:hypothetical protein [Bacteroidota bacterium]
MNPPESHSQVTSSWSLLDDTLDSLVHQADESAGQALASWHEQSEAQLFGPLRTVSAAAGKQHKQTLAQLSSLRQPISTESISAYRMAVTREVLIPIAKGLDTLAPAELPDPHSLLNEALNRLISNADTLRTLPLSLKFYASAPGQKRWMTRRLIWCRHRAINHLRSLLNKPRKPLIRDVPVRSLLKFHAQVRLARTAASLRESGEQQLAFLVASVTAGFTAWTQDILALERNCGTDEQIEHASPTANLNDPSVTLLKIASALQEVLDNVALNSRLQDPIAAGTLTADAQQLRADLRCAGTVLLKARRRQVPPGPTGRTQPSSWVPWHRHERRRLELNNSVLQWQSTLNRCRDDMLQRAFSLAVAPVKDTFRSLTVELDHAQEHCGRHDADKLADALRHHTEVTLIGLRNALGKLPGLMAADAELANPGQDARDQLLAVADGLPEELALHPVPQPGIPIVPAAKPELRNLRQEVLRALAPMQDLLKDCARPLRKKLVDLWTESESAIGVVEFGLKGALTELEENRSADNARELAEGGFQRAVALLQDLSDSLTPPWEDFVRCVHRLYKQQSSDIHHCLRAEANIEERVQGVKVRLRRASELLRRRVKLSFQSYRSLATRLFRLGQSRAGGLIERGRSAMGVAEEIERDRLVTMEGIDPVRIAARLDNLPLVYRRLFAQQPVSLAWQLEGRSADLAYVRAGVERWRQGHAMRPLVIPMLPGSGRTSLVHVIASQFSSSMRVNTFTLNHRRSGPDDFVSHAARITGVKAGSWLELEEALNRSGPRICLLDNLEHLMLRTHGGVDLIEELLLLMSNTVSRVHWIAAVSQFAWQYLEKALQHIADLTDVHPASALTKDFLAGMMLNRHQRSGLKLQFALPATAPQVLSRRLRYTRSDTARQALLRDHWFDRLFSSCGSNLRLALAYWLRAIVIEDGAVTVRPHTPFSFRFLESIGLMHTFALKAFLIHNTLSLKEHGMVLRMTNAESRVVLHSLINQGLVVPCRSDLDPDAVETKQRYRLHPFVLFPVQQHLRKMNIIH